MARFTKAMRILKDSQCVCVESGVIQGQDGGMKGKEMSKPLMTFVPSW